LALSNGLITPGLVLEVVEAAEDYQITSTEFSEIMGTIASTAGGIIVAGVVGMFLEKIAKEFTKETGIKTEKIAGIPLPI
jgi:hypothetical protein